MTLTIATWNINSVRLRIRQVGLFLDRYQPDILCLQEIKCPDDRFPVKPFKRRGYEHILVNGQKGYHGVAIVSRVPFAATDKRGFCDKGDARHACVTIADEGGDILLHNFYIPAGGDEPDPAVNLKFAHKLAFLDEMRAWSAAHKAGARQILVGDLNVAPLETDVWSHKQLLKVVSHTPIEVEKFGRARAGGAWVDVMRRQIPEPTRLYTWWSYRAADWRAADRGRRLDHIWASPDLAPSLGGVTVLKEVRGWERPSDHVPVLASLG
jgi:exodeoxyribonuclease-3